MMKKCSKCKIEKSLDGFPKDQSKKCGYYSSCKNCHSIETKEYGKQYRLKNAEKELKRSREYNKNNKHKKKEYSDSANGRFSRYKSKAKKRGIVFDLSFEEFKYITSIKCLYCLEFTDGRNFCRN